ncbi:Uncharacterised protein [Yersinia rohdei]|uniref:Uncharacterized protein n=1 Tax=Yersinia rohdei TaxID=29485 RepID=A0A0U1HTZ5_YERRO|nr:Uncharacterised protein [Yersinia rohdei]
MGCRGAKVKILSCRPKYLKKNNLLGFVVCLWDLKMVKTRHFYIHQATGNQQQKIEYLAHRASRVFFYA